MAGPGLCVSPSGAHTLIRPLKLRAPFETSLLPAVSPLKKLLQPFHFITTGLLLHTPSTRSLQLFFPPLICFSNKSYSLRRFSILSFLPRLISAFLVSVFHMIFHSLSFLRPPLRTVEAGSDFLSLLLLVPAE